MERYEETYRYWTNTAGNVSILHTIVWNGNKTYKKGIKIAIEIIINIIVFRIV